jgi:hypothetical protein
VVLSAGVPGGPSVGARPRRRPLVVEDPARAVATQAGDGWRHRVKVSRLDAGERRRLREQLEAAAKITRIRPGPPVPAEPDAGEIIDN